MTTEEIFHNEMVELGGRLPRERMDERSAKSYEAIEERAQDLVSAVRHEIPDLPEIHVDFIFNRSVNAAAFASCGKYFIGLTTGTLFMLRSVIGRLLSDRTIFVEIGNPDAELERVPPWKKYVPDAEPMYRSEQVLSPKDPVRRAYAEFLQDQALMFFLGHEMTHIVHGHVDYLRANRNHRFTVELSPAQGGEEERLERQAIEIEADRRSILSRLDSLRADFAQSSPSIYPWKPEAKQPIDVLVDWALSLQIVFHLFGDLHFTGIDPATTDYPPGALRRALCEAAVHGFARQLWGAETAKMALKAALIARFEAERAFRKLLGESSEVSAPPELIPRNYSDRAQMLETYMNSTLAERLRSFRFGG